MTATGRSPSQESTIASGKRLLIIDTDPGIDDAMAILAAFNSPEVEVIGLTTLFGNVRTPTATSNAIFLRELARMHNVPVAQGPMAPINGIEKARIADFVHGSDGFGNTDQLAPTGVPIEQTAAEFLVATVAAHPGKVTVLALAALTNIALALKLDPAFAENMAELVVLGGAFFVNGNVNPAAEANIFGDPEAADYALGLCPRCLIVGLDVTHKVMLSKVELDALRGRGMYGSFLHDITKFYYKYHRESYGMEGIYLHDPTALVAVLQPGLFTWKTGLVRVGLEGIARGHTIMDVQAKEWNAPNAWTGRPQVQVALGVQADKVGKLVWDRMCQ